MKKWIVAPVLALMLSVPALSFAQAASPAQLNLARQVVEFQRGAEQDALLAQLADGAATALVAQWNERVLLEVAKEKQTGVNDKLNAELKLFYDDTLALLKKASAEVEAQDLVNMYAQKFSEDELKALVAWFSSPVFKKYLALTPDLAQVYMVKLGERVQAGIQARQEAFDNKAGAILRAAK